MDINKTVKEIVDKFLKKDFINETTPMSLVSALNNEIIRDLSHRLIKDNKDSEAKEALEWYNVPKNNLFVLHYLLIIRPREREQTMRKQLIDCKDKDIVCFEGEKYLIKIPENFDKENISLFDNSTSCYKAYLITDKFPYIFESKMSELFVYQYVNYIENYKLPVEIKEHYSDI